MSGGGSKIISHSYPKFGLERKCRLSAFSESFPIFYFLYLEKRKGSKDKLD
jgi:hypothetical protein